MKRAKSSHALPDLSAIAPNARFVQETTSKLAPYRSPITEKGAVYGVVQKIICRTYVALSAWQSPVTGGYIMKITIGKGLANEWQVMWKRIAQHGLAAME